MMVVALVVAVIAVVGNDANCVGVGGNNGTAAGRKRIVLVDAIVDNALGISISLSSPPIMALLLLVLFICSSQVDVA